MTRDEGLTRTPTDHEALHSVAPNRREEMSAESFDQAHQGDVYLDRITKLPAGLVAVAPVSGFVTLALGETSGHHHSFRKTDRVMLFRDDGNGGGNFYLRVSPGPNVMLEHLGASNVPTGEHAPISVAAGLYRVPAQMQWTDADEPIVAQD